MSLYDDLGVGKDADSETIKRAYRKKVHKAHPDKGGKAEEFHAIQRAYDVLGDAGRRARYDATGDEKGGPDKQGDILRNLAFLVLSVLDNVDIDRTDVLGLVRQNIERGSADAKQKIEQLKGKIKMRERALARLKKKKPGGENMIAHFIEGDIASNKRAIELGLAAIEHNKEMLKVLADYKYVVDKDVLSPAGERFVAFRTPESYFR